MHPFPHRYVVNAAVRPDGDVPCPPKASGSSSLLRRRNSTVRASMVAGGAADRGRRDCFVLGFRAIAHASKYPWLSLESRHRRDVGPRRRQDAVHAVDIHARLHVPAGADGERAKKLLEKAELSCLVSNSLNSERHLTVEVIVG